MKYAAPLLHIRKAAEEAALASGKVLLRHFGKPLQIREKKGAGLVTNADVESEKTALQILLRSFPDFGILAEESHPLKSRSQGRWIVDALDGTTNFVHGFPFFCVSIAAEWAGKIVAGVIYHPVLDEMYVALRGRGATVNGKKLRVSSTKRLHDSLLTTGFTHRKEKCLHEEMSAFERLSATARAVRRPGSAALDLAYTARGVFEGFWERRLSPWDVAAGTILVEEAGGKVTDYRGDDFQLGCTELLASNGLLHRALLQTLRPEFCPI